MQTTQIIGKRCREKIVCLKSFFFSEFELSRETMTCYLQVKQKQKLQQLIFQNCILPRIIMRFHPILTLSLVTLVPYFLRIFFTFFECLVGSKWCYFAPNVKKNDVFLTSLPVNGLKTASFQCF